MPHIAWRRRLAVALASLLSPLLVQPAVAQDAPDAEAVYRSLAPDVAARAGDPAFDYALGIAALDSGRFGEAIIALQRVLAIQPGHSQARAELARAYALAGDVDTAREQFATVVDDPSLPDPVRQRFTGFVRQFDNVISGGGSDISGFADIRAGHDSNINSATDLNTVTIPLFAFLGPGTLGAAARERGDEFYELSAGVSGVAAIGRQDRLFGSVLGSWRDNIDSRAFDTASLTGTAGYAHTFANRDVLSLSAQAQQFWLGRAPYRGAFGAVAQYTRLLQRGRALTFSAQYNRMNFDNQPLLDADRYAVAVGYVTRTLSANISAGHEETRRRAGDAWSNTFGVISVGAEIPVAEGVAVVGGGAFDLRRYDGRDALFLKSRKDERVDLQAGFKLALGGDLFLVPRATYTRNWSNIPLYDYDRWTVSAGLRLEF